MVIMIGDAFILSNIFLLECVLYMRLTFITWDCSADILNRQELAFMPLHEAGPAIKLVQSLTPMWEVST